MKKFIAYADVKNAIIAFAFGLLAKILHALSKKLTAFYDKAEILEEHYAKKKIASDD